jgi:hypothetical protein
VRLKSGYKHKWSPESGVAMEYLARRGEAANP